MHPCGEVTIFLQEEDTLNTALQYRIKMQPLSISDSIKFLFNRAFHDHSLFLFT